MIDEIRLRVRQRARQTVTLRIKEGHSVDWYAGPYEATPKRVDQYLETKGKTMREDVTVREIPYFETANPYGTTYVIGE